MKTKTKKAAD